MKLFTNKNLIQKLIIAIVVVTLLNFCFAPRVRADFGGKMMSYIRDFATALGDVTISVIQFGLTGKWVYAVDDEGAAETDGSSEYWIKDSKIRYPIIQLSPELIFSDKVELLNADFIGGSEGKQYILKTTDGSAVSALRRVISSWYVTLRTIAIVGLLSVLLYIGIRIMISSTSQDRAKYKQRMVDWVVAFCLLFFMHYIMAATVNVVGKVNEVLGNNLVSRGIPLNSAYGNVTYNPAGTGDVIYSGPNNTNPAELDMGARNQEAISIVNNWFNTKGYGLTNSNPEEQFETTIIGAAGDGNTQVKHYWMFETTDGETLELYYLVQGSRRWLFGWKLCNWWKFNFN